LLDSSTCGVECEKTNVDAKFFTEKVSGRASDISGRRLFLTLFAGLMLASILLDAVAGRLLTWDASLTLPFTLSALLVGTLGFQVVPLLQAWKTGQVIREDGPKSHLQKAGTPTMGGVFVVPVGLGIALLWSGFSIPVVGASAITLAYGLIGWLDDWKILKLRSNKGISPRLKLALQIACATAFCAWVLFTQPALLSTLALPLGLTLPLGILFLPVAGFALVAESNSTNLTDGLDGLAAGTGAITLLGLGAVIAPNYPDLMVFCAAMAGAYLGFLVHNHNPARVFMGDTGSLALGGALAAAAILSQSLFALLLLGGLFLAEALSVLAQVSYYKATKDKNGIGKRLFRMAPLHHHFELNGWSELQVVYRFYLISAGLAIATLLLYLI
jgi:phospho-N-acetylmuramoyl-pentapeptide-transferase